MSGVKGSFLTCHCWRTMKVLVLPVGLWVSVHEASVQASLWNLSSVLVDLSEEVDLSRTQTSSRTGIPSQTGPVEVSRPPSRSPLLFFSEPDPESESESEDPFCNITKEKVESEGERATRTSITRDDRWFYYLKKWFTFFFTLTPAFFPPRPPAFFSGVKSYWR